MLFILNKIFTWMFFSVSTEFVNKAIFVIVKYDYSVCFVPMQ